MFQWCTPAISLLIVNTENVGRENGVIKLQTEVTLLLMEYLHNLTLPSCSMFACKKKE